MTQRTCLKVAYLRTEGYEHLEEWLARPNNCYVGRSGRIFITEEGERRVFLYPGSKWGNPYKVSEEQSLDQVLELYREHLYQSDLISEITELRGLNLGCWCLPEQPCHTDILLEELEKRERKPPCLVFEEEWWDYVPEFLDAGLFEPLYQEMSERWVTYPIRFRNAEFRSRRMSCVITDTSQFSKTERELDVYDGIPHFDWKETPVLSQIREEVESFLEEQFDYCLVHLYRDGNDTINWHNDKEALNTRIASLSLGATRKFRLKPIGQTKGWTDEYLLRSGDMIDMKPGCQRKMVHTLVAQKGVDKPRINLTFRKRED